MNKSLVIIDVQPFYHKYHEWITPELMDYINESEYEDILWFFNSEEVGIEDSKLDLISYAIENGLDEDKIEQISFLDKYYAFFRNWMDMGVDEDFIVHIVKYMIKEDINDSRDIDEDLLEMLAKKYYGDDTDIMDTITTDNIHIPHFEWGAIHNLGSVDIVGGGCNECLLEMELLFEAVNVKTNRINRFVY